MSETKRRAAIRPGADNRSMTSADPSVLAFCRRAIARVERIDTSSARADDAVGDELPILRHVGGGIVASHVVVDGGREILVTGRHLRAAGLPADELHAIARRNLGALALPRVDVEHFGHIFVAVTGLDLEASLILCDAFWDDLQATSAPGGFVAAIPGRELIAFGDAASTDAIRELEDFCTRVEPALVHPLTDRLYRRAAGRWEPLADDGGSARDGGG